MRDDTGKWFSRRRPPREGGGYGKLKGIGRSASTPAPSSFPAWWGRTELDVGEVHCWRVGPTTLWVERRALEWRLHRRQADEELADDSAVAARCERDEIDPAATLERFAFGRTRGPLEISPLLADRSVVIRPEAPFFIPSGADVTLYVSTPLWLRVEVGDPAQTLSELPSYRPSDTWFGPSTLLGELCYASRTTGRLELAELPHRPQRAVTPVRIRNAARSSLLLERVKVPVQYLSLYRDRDSRLWTETATLLREEGGDLAALQLGKRAPAEAVEAELLRGPRQQAESRLALRAFSRLFGGE